MHVTNVHLEQVNSDLWGLKCLRTWNRWNPSNVLGKEA